MTSRLSVFCVAGCLCLASVLPATTPVAVSPGASNGIAHLADPCPTFSWSAVPDATGYELVVLAASRAQAAGPNLDAAADVVEPELSIAIGGAAIAWTPTAEHCFEPEERYAWSVRARLGETLGPWAEAQLFELDSGAASELERAVETILERLLAERGLAAAQAARPELASYTPVTSEAVQAESSEHRDQASPLAVIPGGATAAAYSSMPDTGGVVTYGVHGVSHSAEPGSIGVAGEATAPSGATRGVVGSVASIDGVGGLFENTAGGKLLAGTNGAIEVFTVSGAGAVTALSFAGDGLGLTGVSAGVASDLVCTDCVAEPELDFDPATQGELDGHDHFGANWSGSVGGGYSGLHVENTSTDPFSYGIFAKSSSPTGAAVEGRSMSSTPSGGTGVSGSCFNDGCTGVAGSASDSTGASDAVAGLNHSASGRGVLGIAAAGNGTNVGVWGESLSPSGFGGFFANEGGGDLLAGSNTADPSDLDFRVDNDGDVTAKSYSGDGDGLTGVTAAGVACTTNCVESSEITDGTIALADIGQNGCSTGQLIQWNGSSWSCTTQSGGVSGYERVNTDPPYICFPANTYCQHDITCPGGKVVLGGGVGDADEAAVVRESYPRTDSSWRVGVFADGAVAAFSVYAVCADP